MIRAEMVAFAVPKQASAPGEWEDGARFDEGFARGRARLIVADGATEAFDTNRWVGLMVETFVPADDSLGPAGAPRLETDAMTQWFKSLQRHWIDGAPTEFGSHLAEAKFKTSGSFATMVGCELSGLEGARPMWRAAAVGDTVLFHVRRGAARTVFPAMGPGDFGTNPAVVHTDPNQLDRMISDLQFSQGAVVLDDWLFVATDALADWVVRSTGEDEQTVWAVLAGLDDRMFHQFVEDQRAGGTLTDDDVTLLRVHFVDRPSRLSGRR